MTSTQLFSSPAPQEPVFADHLFATPWVRFDYIVQKAGSGPEIPAATNVEQGFFLLEGKVCCTVESAAVVQAQANSALLLSPGTSPILSSAEGARLIHMGVAYAEDASLVDRGTGLRCEGVEAEKLNWRPAIHGGAGKIATRHIWGPDDFVSSWSFVDHAILAPHSSVGYHYHDAMEESFIILSGRGYMTIDGNTFQVQQGTTTWQGIGKGHGIYNPESEALEFLRVAVAQADEEFTTVDLVDDLSVRLPAETG